MDSCDFIDLASDDEVTSSKVAPPSEKKTPNGVLKLSSSSDPVLPNEKHSSSSKNGCDAFKIFVDTCLKYDNSPTMQKIIKTKVWKNYDNANPAYRSTAAFKQFVEERTEKVISDPTNIYVPIKELVDELKTRVLKASAPPKKRAKLMPAEKYPKKDNLLEHEAENALEEEEKEEEPPNTEVKASDRLMRRLCKTLQLLHRKIKKLETKDVTWDDDSDSSYIQLQRYKERFIQVHRKLQEYEGEMGDVDRNVKRITFSGTQFPTVNRTIEKYVNKKGEFPDFLDILKLLKSTYEAENINITPEMLRVQAKAVFQDIGGQLQKKRQLEYWDCHCTYLGSERDPADEDPDLRAKLHENKVKYGGRIDEVINEFVEKSLKQNLQPEELPGSESNSRANSLKEDENDGDEGNDDGGGGDGDDDYDDDDDDDDDEEEGEEDEDGCDDFMEKLIEAKDDYNEDFKDDDSLDGDDAASDLDIRYAGPVSPPHIETDFSDEDISGEAEVCGDLSTDTTVCMAVYDNDVVSEALMMEEHGKDSSASEKRESKEGNIENVISSLRKHCVKLENSGSDTKQNLEKLAMPEASERPTTPKILESLGMTSSSHMHMKSISKEHFPPDKGDDDDDDDLEIITLD